MFPQRKFYIFLGWLETQNTPSAALRMIIFLFVIFIYGKVNHAEALIRSV
jgi:hypothetical protein